ncbi:MAG: hypothetical protein Q9216_001096 [Gyalolechia sp. 2 TL-2023]
MPNDVLGFDDKKPWGKPNPIPKPPKLPGGIQKQIDDEDEAFYQFDGPTQGKPGDEDSNILLYDYILRYVIHEWEKGVYDSDKKGGAVEGLMDAWQTGFSLQITEDEKGAMLKYRQDKRKDYVRIFLPVYQSGIFRDLADHIKALPGGK